MPENSSAPKTLFISRASADADFAAVVGKILEDAGYNIILQQWDFANRSFMDCMHSALAEGSRVVALLSPEYLSSDHCRAEWQNAIASDPLNTKSRLILLRVAECEPIGLLSALAYWDLVPVRDNRALLRDILLDAVREQHTPTLPAGPYWRAPRSIVDAETIRPVPNFSGRDTELISLTEALLPPNAVVAVHGLGGVGKSSIVREYAWRHRDEYSVIWCLNGESDDAIVDGLLRLGSLFVRGLEQHADRRAAAANVVGSILSGFEKPVLLILDNLEDERLLRAWQPRNNGRLLATSRNTAWSADVTEIALTTWSNDAAVAYLQRESGRSDLTYSHGRAIAEALGALPLALSHAAASLRGMRMVTPGRYLERIGEYLKKSPRSVDYPRSVFATFTAAIANAEKEAPGAAAVLSFAASFAADTIPEELFHQPIDVYSQSDLRFVVADDMVLDEALGQLDRFSLLAYSPASHSYAMHRLVQRAALDRIAETQSAWIESAIAAANAAFPEVDFATWPQCERVLPHARAALDALPTDSTFLMAGRLAHKCAVYLRERGNYAAAEALQLRALSIFEKAPGENRLDIARALNDLGRVYYSLGRYDEAERLHVRALAIHEELLSPRDTELACSLHYLADLYQSQGKYAEAESMHARALAIRESALGSDHPDVAHSLTDFSMVYYRQERYDEVIAMLERALAILERALGPDHPDVGSTLNDLAFLHFRQKRLSEAERLHGRALAIREKTLGPEHPDVANSIHNLAAVYCAQRRFDEAEPLHARALAIKEKMSGPDHPHVAAILSDIASLYGPRRRFEDAEALHRRALSIREKALGPDHHEVAMSLHNLAKLYASKERYDDAMPLYERALMIREKALGSDHAWTKGVRKERDALVARMRKASKKGSRIRLG